MGKGDKKTKKGKIFMGSFGKVRPYRDAKKVEVQVEVKAKAKKK
jgi:30S ribosomal protein S31